MFHTMIGAVAAAAALIIGPPAVPPGTNLYHNISGGERGVEPGYAARPAIRLTLTYLADAGFAAAVKLDCEPVGGGHPQGEQACATLQAAGGDPERIPPAHTMCMTIYAPIEAEISGVWRGTSIEWRHRYGNSCEMRRATGAVFSF